MERYTTTHDRYQITDPICGLVETATSLKDALRKANMHRCDAVEVFDTMARYDCAQTWNREGRILTFRHRVNE
jgi:hypothetical protein